MILPKKYIIQQVSSSVCLHMSPFNGLPTFSSDTSERARLLDNYKRLPASTLRQLNDHYLWTLTDRFRKYIQAAFHSPGKDFDALLRKETPKLDRMWFDILDALEDFYNLAHPKPVIIDADTSEPVPKITPPETNELDPHIESLTTQNAALQREIEQLQASLNAMNSGESALDKQHDVMNNLLETLSNLSKESDYGQPCI